MDGRKRLQLFTDAIIDAAAAERTVVDLDERITTWFVGIAAGTMALLLSHFTGGDTRPGFVEKIAVLALGATILTGVAQRVVMRVAVHRDVRQRALMRQMLLGLREVTGETREEWDADYNKIKAFVGPLFQKNEVFDSAEIGAEVVVVRKIMLAASILFYACVASIIIAGAAVVVAILW
jgi:hypothetical protein